MNTQIDRIKAKLHTMPAADHYPTETFDLLVVDCLACCASCCGGNSACPVVE